MYPRRSRSAAHRGYTGTTGPAGRLTTEAAGKQGPHQAGWDRAQEERQARERVERQAHCALLRDIFRPRPFSNTTLIPAWLTPNVDAVATTIYAECRFDDLPVLADALEDAGCADQTILDHLHSPGPHVRGCWILDAILWRE